MAKQASTFGTAELSRSADVVNAALTEMTGATSPRLHLELMVARILVPASDDTERGALARVERLERRVGMEGATTAAPPPTAAATTAPTAAPATTAPGLPKSKAASPVEPAVTAAASPAPVADEPAPGAAPAAPTAPAATAPAVAAAAPEAAPVEPAPEHPVGPVTLQQVKDAWPEILESVKSAKLNAWLVVYTAQPLELRDGKTLVLSFPSQKDVEELKKPASPGQGVGDLLKKAFVDVLGLEPALIARVDANAAPPARPADEPPVDEVPPADEFPPTESQGWAVAVIPDAAPPAAEPAPRAAAPKAATTGQVPDKADKSDKTDKTAETAPGTPTSSAPTSAAATDSARYGESVVRELLGASFIEEQAVAPRVVPVPRDE
jgi:DNA polymerase-3 subunit gamma/tau